MKAGLFALLASALVGLAVATSAAPIRVVVWDERQEAQKSAYGGFLGDTLAGKLSENPSFSVKSVGLNDPDQGLTDATLDQCDVLIWWGHQKHAEVTDEKVAAIIKRLKEGRLSLIALHSAHWSKPFVAAMNERSIQDALQSVPKEERGNVKIVQIPPKGGLPGPDDPITPSFRRYKADDGTDTLEVKLPGCIFPVVKNDGTPSHVHVKATRHPIAAGIPHTFDIPQTEVYGGPFHVPKPDAMIFQETWDDGNSFTSGCTWTVGKGKVFYFRPGHETYAIYTQEYPLRIIQNAIRWAAGKTMATTLTSGDDELSSVDFAPGESALAKSEMEKLRKLASALHDQPGTLQISGACSPSADAAVLARRDLLQQVKKERAEELVAAGQSVPSVDSIQITSGDYARLIEKLYNFNSGSPGANASGQEPVLVYVPDREESPIIPSGPVKGGERLIAHQNSDHPTPKPAKAVAPSPLNMEQMEQRLLANIHVTDDELRELEQARARAVQSALLDVGQLATNRVLIMPPKPVTSAQGETRVSFSLE